MNKLVPFLLLIFLLTGFPALAVEPGTLSPDFSLKTLQGESVSLSAYKGQPIILKLATTWCPTCKQQSQELEAIGDYLKQHNIVVVEVFLQDSDEMIRDYLKTEHLPNTHVALLDDGSALKAFSVYLIPRVIFIDRDFKVRRDGSLIPGQELVKEWDKILGSGGSKLPGS